VAERFLLNRILWTFFRKRGRVLRAMDDSGLKARILARRNRFLALAVSGAGVVACSPTPRAEPATGPVIVTVDPPEQPKDASADSVGDAAVQPEATFHSPRTEQAPDFVPVICLSFDPDLP
ncbi:MAG TPA: hypothetical protein PLV85_12685, partial [Polyangiaceae bacterium]|nr:hypothetical protein [Polyangiaceae bacterium]